MVHTLSHPALSILPVHFAESTIWKASFYIVLVGIAAAGWLLSKDKEKFQEKWYAKRNLFKGKNKIYFLYSG